ncbi:MAG: peptidylprolyl isomerase [Brevundimonas sp.]|nr:peptidylprolyl isomerase [Brevundimonas sp.]
MRFGWAKAAGFAGILALAACGRGASAPVSGADADKNAEASAAWMTTNAKADGVQSLPSGLQYKVVQSGPAGSPTPDANDMVVVDYEGALVDGTVFDSSFQRGKPYATHVEDVVPGWIEALQRMKVGDEWMLYVPPALGYGAADQGTIPPNSVMVFRIKLLDMAPVPGGTVRGVGQANG